MTYSEALDYIHSVQWKGSRPGLSRTVELTNRLGRPQDHLHFIHIAGTNGKGSTSAMIASILQKAGYRVGLYTSPFIVRFNERMQVNGQPVSDGELAELTALVRPFAETMEDVPTEFELITAIALVYFARHACDYVVFEVGMGGRLDSTNIIDEAHTILSVITGISLDHTAYLGDTVEKIAREKAGIIKKGVPVLFGGHHTPIGNSGDGASCAAVIRSCADEAGSPYTETDERLLTVRKSDIHGTDLDFGAWKNLHLPLSGLYQPYNAATVLTAVLLLREQGIAVPDTAVREGLAAVRWPARFEILSDDPHPLIIADGAHNPEGIAAAVESIRRYFGGEKVLLLTGVMADKNYARMIRDLGTVTARAYTVRPANDRALDPARYTEAFEAAGIPSESFPTVFDGIRAAAGEAARQGKPLICLGSLYMYGEVREAVLHLFGSQDGSQDRSPDGSPDRSPEKRN